MKTRPGPVGRSIGNGKGVPILLKQYLKLGGKVLCFNVDHHFGNTLDGLMMVDLTLTDPKVLKRYMGEDGLRTFQDYHIMEHTDQSPWANNTVMARQGA